MVGANPTFRKGMLGLPLPVSVCSLGSRNRMLDLINVTPMFANGEHNAYTASAGLAQFRKSDTPESLYQRAGQSLYSAKKSGRACLVHDTPGAPALSLQEKDRQQDLPS